MRADRPRLTELVLAEDPAAWRGLGFAVRDGTCQIGATALRLAGVEAGEGIVAWALAGATPTGDSIDGLATRAATAAPGSASVHPNGALAIDHVVVHTPAPQRTFAALELAGLELRRTRQAGTPTEPMVQGFFLLREALVEVVGPAEPVSGGPAVFWGLVVVVADLDAAAALLGDQLGTARAAVQPGRRIATVRRESGVHVPLALMTPRENQGPGP